MQLAGLSSVPCSFFTLPPLGSTKKKRKKKKEKKKKKGLLRLKPCTPTAPPVRRGCRGPSKGPDSKATAGASTVPYSPFGVQSSQAEFRVNGPKGQKVQETRESSTSLHLHSGQLKSQSQHQPPFKPIPQTTQTPQTSPIHLCLSSRALLRTSDSGCPHCLQVPDSPHSPPVASLSIHTHPHPSP